MEGWSRDGGVVLEDAGSEARLLVTPIRPPVPGERPPSSMVPSILVNTAQGSKLVIGGSGGELIISAVAQVSLGAPGWNVASLGNPAVLLSWGQGGVVGVPAALSLSVPSFSPPGHREQTVAWF